MSIKKIMFAISILLIICLSSSVLYCEDNDDSSTNQNKFNRIEMKEILFYYLGIGYGNHLENFDNPNYYLAVLGLESPLSKEFSIGNMFEFLFYDKISSKPSASVNLVNAQMIAPYLKIFPFGNDKQSFIPYIKGLIILSWFNYNGDDKPFGIGAGPGIGVNFAIDLFYDNERIDLGIDYLLPNVISKAESRDEINIIQIFIMTSM